MLVYRESIDSSSKKREVSSMRAGILFRPSVLFFALGLVVFVTVAALSAGESSAEINCAPDGINCSGGAGGPGGGGGGHESCTGETRDTCTFSGGGGGPGGGAGGRVDLGERTDQDCLLAGRPNPDIPRCP
jgi:hypothetical protein